MTNIQRNDPCWCGSGKKFKHCHLAMPLEHKTTDVNFYRDKIETFRKVKLLDLNEADEKKLISDLHTNFNFIFLFTSKLDFDRIVRVTVNERVIKKNSRISTVDLLSYPKPEYCTTYGRANKKQNNVFYAGFHEPVCIREAKPESNQLITISEWTNISGEPLIYYPISYSDIAATKNSQVAKEKDIFHAMKANLNPDFYSVVEMTYKFMADEFAKEVSEPIEYLFSAFFGDKIMPKHKGLDPKSAVELIKYPSVADNHLSENLAIRTDVVDHKLKIKSVVEFMVENIDLSKYPDPAFVKLKQTGYTDKFDGNKIMW